MNAEYIISFGRIFFFLSNIIYIENKLKKFAKAGESALFSGF